MAAVTDFIFLGSKIALDGDCSHEMKSRLLLGRRAAGGGLVAKLHLTLETPWTVTLPGSSVHGILQARILKWVAISFSRGSSQPRDRTLISCIAGRQTLYQLSYKRSPILDPKECFSILFVGPGAT